MRRIPWIAVLAAALLAVTAPAGLSQPVELRFMTCGGGLENWTEAVAMWNERNPDVRVVHEHIPICWEPLYERIMVEYAAGTAPDVARMGLAFWSGMKENGMLYDIMPILERLGFDPSEYFPGIMEYERDGGMYGLSSSIYSLATVINEDHFNEVGLPLPSTDWTSTWTHDEYREALRLLTRYEPDGSLVRAGTTLYLHPERIIQYFWQKGGSWFTPDGRRSAVNDEIGIATLEWLHEILHVDRSAITNTAGDGAFNTALTSVHTTGQWFRPADDINARVRPLPRDVGGPATPMFIDPYIVLSTTKYPEEATRFLMFLISEDVAELFIQRRHIGVPMHRATVLNMLDSMFGNLPPEDKLVWIDAMDYTRRVPFTPNWTEIVQASTEELQKLANNQATPRAVADELARRINLLLAELDN